MFSKQYALSLRIPLRTGSERDSLRGKTLGTPSGSVYITNGTNNVNNTADMTAQQSSSSGYNSTDLIISDAIVTNESGNPMAARLDSESSTSGLPVGAWVGIGFCIFFLCILGIVLFFGHRRVTDTLVAKLARQKRRIFAEPSGRNAPIAIVGPTPTRTHSAMLIKMSYTGSSSTHRTSVPDIPFAPVEVDPDGRLSPRLPIASKRGSYLPGTPNSTSLRCALMSKPFP